MRFKVQAKKSVSLWVLLALLVMLGHGCIPEDPPNPDPASASDPAQPGAYTKCTYDQGLEDADYKDAIVYYPCESSGGPFPASTLTGGWTNVKEQMDWIGSHVVTHGYVVIAMTPNDNMGFNSEWRKAHNAGIAKLKTENSRSGSPINGLVNTRALQIMGYSKGGGGTLLAANDQGANIKTAQALAPYIDYPQYDISNIKAATICYTGTEDTVAPPQRVVGMYQQLPRSIPRTLAYFNGMGHMAWWNMGSRDNHTKILTYMVSWMKVYLSDDSRFAPYLDGHQEWFYQFEHGDANADGGADDGGSGGCGT